ncbi:MAG TPA: 1-acyl-sn-glycerol-3-phosphate acyltransferase [Gemmataceae bacterium]|jgi:1-acyl-sn-glycerol-3-phosphate acyltransferase|nr:1-acyl-sn-glycerol-3-phosphate acyltransferase [Gemmataceae bacterium]
MAPQRVARLQLFILCLAVACRTTVYAASTYLCLSLLQNHVYTAYAPGTLAAWLGICSIPALILTPVIGPLAGSRWNRTVHVGGSFLMLLAIAWANFGTDVSWLSIVGILSLELAFFGPAVLRVATAVSTAARISATMTRVWMVLAAVGGFWLFAGLNYVVGRTSPAFIFGFAIASTLAVLVATCRPVETVSLAQGFIKPFVAGVREALAHRRARHALVGLWLWGFVALTVIASLFRAEAYLEVVRQNELMRQLQVCWLRAPDDWIDLTNWRFASAIGVGVLATSIGRHTYRHAGFVLYAAPSTAAALLWLRFGEASSGPLMLIGLALGFAISPLVNYYFTWTSAKQHGVAAALVVAGWSAVAIVLAILVVNFGDDPIAVPPRLPFLNILLAVTAFAFVAGFASFFRPAMELTLEMFFWPIYRIRSSGPGIANLPERGPYIVIGNHAAWFDPLFFAKILPTPIVPMMISKFYDVPVISWIMRHVIGTIRVPDKAVRHEAPELKEAVAALDRGECVVVFPEGYLRRKEEVPLKRFGRGIWQILKDRPQTPVFACWIEGTWGSYLSHRGGPPTKGKRIDFWRSIRIGVVGPVPIEPKMLDDHMATRLFLMRQVSEARRPLGLEPLALPAETDAEGDNA